MRTALRQASGSHAATLEEWLHIARTPSLPGHEAERARLVRDLFEAAGLVARILPDGNVEGRLAGSGTGTPAVISAHLDALHAPSSASDVRERGGIVIGPGVLDDASGLVAITRAARLLVRSGWKPDRPLRFVATVGEEVGLVGAKSYIGANPQLAAFVTIDGILGNVDYGATGIRWTRFTFTGPGGHTLLSDRTPSPSFAAGRALAAIAELAESTDAPINVGQVAGGTSPNAIPVDVSFTVDVRSNSDTELSRLSSEIARVSRAAADREGVAVRFDTLQDLPAAQLPGLGDSALVRGAVDILSFLNVPSTAVARGSADHNVALLHRIPGIAVGSTTGLHAHAPEETADPRALEKGVQQVILLTVLLGEGLPEPVAVAQ